MLSSTVRITNTPLFDIHTHAHCTGYSILMRNININSISHNNVLKANQLISLKKIKPFLEHDPNLDLYCALKTTDYGVMITH